MSTRLQFASLFFVLYCSLLIALTFCQKKESAYENTLDTVRILSFNILYGGDEIDFSKVVEAIRKSNAGIVGVQEAEGNIPRLAQALGWKYYDSRLQVLSQFPRLSFQLSDTA